MKPIRTLKISISGVRGVVGDSLTPALLVRFAESFGTFINSGNVVIGRDTRTSGEMVMNAVCAGLMSSGCKIINIGVCPVPTIQMMIREFKADGGIAITASHNPVEWNALKFIRADGCFLNQYQAEEMLHIYHQGEYRKVLSSDIKSVVHIDSAIDKHLESIIDYLGVLKNGRKKIKVVIDCCNGAGSLMSPRLLQGLGCDVVPINIIPNGIFPHSPEPLPENLSELCDVVKKYDADIGFAQDADADRLAIVSEKGEPIGEDYTLVLAADYVLQRTPGTVVANLSTTMALDDIANKYNCAILKTKIGEVNVTEKMKIEKAVIGGEGNGGVIFPAINFARDSMTAIALILHHINNLKMSVSSIVELLPKYVILKDKIYCPSDKIQSVLEMLKQEYICERLNLTDGIKILREGAWGLVRPSNTEPILRIMAEAQYLDRSKIFLNEIRSKIEKFLVAFV